MSSTDNHKELKTIRDFLRFCSTQFNHANLFYGHGTNNAWDESAALIFYILKLPHDLFPQVLDARITAEEKIAILELANQRITTRKPLPYLTHEAWFGANRFYVDENVLIP